MREGDQAPGMADGVTFDLLLPLFLEVDPVLNGATRTAFYATLVRPEVATSSDVGLWSNTAGSLALLAQEGDQAPGTPPGVTFLTLAHVCHLRS